MNEVGSGGIGAISVGISEWLVWVLIPVVLALLVLGMWKLVKFLWALSG